MVDCSTARYLNTITSTTLELYKSKLEQIYHRVILNTLFFMKKILYYILKILPPKISIQLRYYYNFKRVVNFHNPKTFTEKIQWLKIYNKNPLYTSMVDKYTVKDYVCKIIGGKYIIPTYGAWENPEDIEWSSLPAKFVLKTTHAGGSNGVIICRDINSFDKKEAIIKLKKSLLEDSYSISKEYPYKDVKRRIIAEKLLEASSMNSDIDDYKFYCFNGEPKYCQVIRNRRTKETIDFYDMEWRHQEFIGLTQGVQNGVSPVLKPIHLDEMITICRKLSKDIPFLRVDLYVIDDRVYFGELTFFPASGMGRFYPEKYNSILGDMINLPKV